MQFAHVQIIFENFFLVLKVLERLIALKVLAVLLALKPVRT